MSPTVYLIIIFLYCLQRIESRKCPKGKVQVYGVGVICGTHDLLSAATKDQTGNTQKFYVDHKNTPLSNVPWGDGDEYVYHLKGKGSDLTEWYRYKIPKSTEIPEDPTEADVEFINWEMDPKKDNFVLEPSETLGIKWINPKKGKIKFTNAEKEQLDQYKKYLNDIVDAQKGPELFLIGKQYLNPYHARYKNKWVLVKEPSKSMYQIPLLGVKGNAKIINKKFYFDSPKTIIEFKFDKAHPDKVHMDVLSAPKFTIPEQYDIYWFVQTHGQCVLHSIRAFAQTDTVFPSCKSFHQMQDRLIPKVVPDPTFGTYFPHDVSTKCKACNYPIEKPKTHDLDKKRIKEGKKCDGWFTPCLLETLLVSQGFQLFQMRQSVTKKKTYSDIKSTFQSLYDKFVSANSGIEPVGIWFMTGVKGPQHSMIIRSIRNSAGLRVWIDLNSMNNPQRVKMLSLDKAKVPSGWDQKPSNVQIWKYYLIYPVKAKITAPKGDGWKRYDTDTPEYLEQEDTDPTMKKTTVLVENPLHSLARAFDEKFYHDNLLEDESIYVYSDYNDHHIIYKNPFLIITSTMILAASIIIGCVVACLYGIISGMTINTLYGIYIDKSNDNDNDNNYMV